MIKQTFRNFDRQEDSTFILNNFVIENVKQYKYVGVIMSSDLSKTREVEPVHHTFDKNVGM